jgi:L-amino acid N-acyltransferase
VDRIAAIYNEAVRTTVATFDTRPRTRAEQRAWFTHHDRRHPIVVAETSRHVVGWGSITAWSDRRAYDATGEDSVYVASSSRGQGVGGAILAELLDRAGALGYHSLLARVAEGNPASLRLHRSAGFREVGVMREVGYKFDRWVDVRLLQRPIAPAGPPLARRRGPRPRSQV